MRHKLVNYYMQLNPSQETALINFLAAEGIRYFDATAFDPYVSGPCACDSLVAIQEDLIR